MRCDILTFLGIKSATTFTVAISHTRHPLSSEVAAKYAESKLCPRLKHNKFQTSHHGPPFSWHHNLRLVNITLKEHKITFLKWRENHTSHYLCSQTLLTLWNFAKCYPMSTARRDTWCQGLELTWKLSVHPKWALSWATEKHEHVHPTHPHVSSFPLYQMIHPYAGKT